MDRRSLAILVALGFLACSSSEQQRSGASGAAETTSPPPSTAAAAAPAPAAPLIPEAPKPSSTQEATPAAAAAATVAPADGKPTVDVHISVNGIAMKFDVTTITASAGQRVHVVLENKLPGTLPHNWTLVMPGTEAAVAAEGLKHADAGYFAPGPNILAHSEMVPPGKTTDVIFDAPKDPGKYPYICTFPGHYMLMKGVLEVTP